MKIISTLLFLLTLFSCNSPDINDKHKRNENWVWWVDKTAGKGEWIPYSNRTTVTDGSYTTFYFNGLIYSHGKLNGGKEIDTTYFYDYDGTVSKYRIHSPDTIYFPKNGSYKGFAQRGGIREEGIVENHTFGNYWIWYYDNGKVSGKKLLDNNTGWKTNYYKSGQIEDSTHYTSGIIDGKVFHWFENGQVKEICDWKMRVQDGEYTTYYENGNLKQKSTWKNGKRDGESVGWFPNKQIEFQYHWDNGKAVGKHLSYFESGHVEKDFNFTNGIKERTQFQYHSNGKLLSVGESVNGNQNGLWKWYDSTGVLTQTDTYRDGKLIKVDKR